MIYVTHDQVDAMTLADKIAVMDKGRIGQIGVRTNLDLNAEQAGLIAIRIFDEYGAQLGARPFATTNPQLVQRFDENDNIMKR